MRNCPVSCPSPSSNQDEPQGPPSAKGIEGDVFWEALDSLSCLWVLSPSSSLFRWILPPISRVSSGVSAFCDTVSQPGSCCGDRSIPLHGKSHAGSFLPQLSSQGCVTRCPSSINRAPLGASTEPDNVRRRMIMMTGPCPHEAQSKTKTWM